MTVSVEVPSSYGYVILTCIVGPFIASTVMGGEVMKARKTYNVPYPNLYATPGYHKQADEFNRIQRGHQNFFEYLDSFTAMSLLGGLYHPITVAVSGVVFSIGSVLFQLGYADTKQDVKVARYKKGGLLSRIAFLVTLGTGVKVAGNMIGWW